MEYYTRRKDMSIDEMLNIFSVEDIKIIRSDSKSFDEMHGNNEDFYRLSLDNECGLYYETREKNNAEECVRYFESSDEAVSFFCFFMLRTHLLVDLRELYQKYTELDNESLTEDELRGILNKMKIDENTYSLSEDTSLDVNFFFNKKLDVYMINFNVEGRKIVSTEITNNRVRAHFKFLDYVVLNNMLINSSIKGVFNHKLEDIEYYYFFEPYMFLKS